MELYPLKTRPMFKALSLVLLGIFFLTPTVSADTATSTETVDAIEEEMVSEDMPILCGGGCGYNPGIYISVNTNVVVEADKVYLHGSFTVDNAMSKKEAVQEMISIYKDMQSKLSEYGTVQRTGIYSYADWEYTNLYDGSLSIKVTLTKPSKVEMAENVMYENGFDSWREVMVSNVNGEKKATPTLKELIKEKKGVYEDILEYSLGEISGLNIYSWADGTSYDPKTNMVNLFVNADVTYYRD
jgi:hypothetical protein